ncbi:MAG: lipase family protein [Cyclobacteriaceae bacterium]
MMIQVKRILMVVMSVITYTGYSQCGVSPTVTPGSRCGTGTVVLIAGSATSGTFRWYSVATGGTALQTSASATSNSYTTVSLSATTTYYVTFHNGTCESSPRTAIVATINALPTAPTAVAGLRCGTGTVTIGANSATAGTFKWYSALTAGTLLQTSAAGLTTNNYTTPSISTTTTYYVTITNANNCESSPRRAVTATVNAVPAAPTVTAGSTCGPGTVIVAANSSTAGTFKWYSASTGGTLLQTSAAAQTTNNYTTPSLSVTTTYYVSVTSSSNCESATRTAVTTTVNANSPASAPSVTNGSRCGTGAVSLSASSATAGTFRWYTTLTGGTLLQTSASATSNSYTTPSISATTTYYVTFNNGTCESTPRVAVTATVNAVATAPTPTPAARCGTGTVILSATSASAGTFRWYSALTGGSLLRTSAAGLTTDSYTTPSISATTTYYVTFHNGTCESSPRTAIAASVNAVPAAPTVVAGSRCGPGTVSLTANSATAGTFKWYDAGTGGNLLQTSTAAQTTNSFPTPALSTTTTYYVTITNSSNCESATRTPITATINPLPAPYDVTGGGMYTSTVPGSVGLSGSVTGTSYQLLLNGVNSGAAVAGTGSTLSWNTSTEGAYTVQATLGSCSAVMNSNAKVQSQQNYTLNEFAFLYKYDGRKRMSHKKVPGADWVYMVYDNRDRLLMTQDGNQRLQNQWLFTKYDALNRPVLTGIYSTGSSVYDQVAMQGLVNSYYDNLGTNNGSWYETFSTSGAVHGYDNKSFPPVSDVNQYLTVTYYDDYSFKALYSNDPANEYRTGQVSSQTSATGTYSQPTTWKQQVKGQATATKTKVLGSSPTNFLLNIAYYDDKYRTIQSISDNHKGGKDCMTNIYDFSGKVLATKIVHGLPSVADKTTARTFDYDHAGRLLKTWHSVNGATAVLLTQNEYNEIGQLVTKNLHNTDPVATPDANRQYKQNVDYRYNIRGWLTKVNDATTPTASDLFSMDLNYNTPTVASAAQYNGNISETIWRGSDARTNSYVYSYDPMNRLVEAKYYNTTDPTRNGRFDEKIWNNQSGTSGYDLNGNIKFLTRKGKTGVVGGITTYGLMDDMGYTYLGNRLQRVDDNAVDTEGFIETNSAANDYTYDVNGNMVTDKNKNITGGILYNHMNLPEKVTKNTNEYVKYTYDAGGRKLKQEVYNASNVVTKTTDYIGEYIYENNILQFINHEEGRIVKDVSSGNYNEYQYNLKDHLGNVRLTFTSKANEVETTTATLEAANLTTEQGQFLYYDKARRIYSHIFDRTNGVRTSAPPNNTTPGYAVRLSGVEKEKIGLSRSLSVMPGDVIKIQAYAKYFVADNNYPDFTSFVNSIIAGTAAQGSVIFDGPGYNVPAPPVPFSTALSKSSEVGPEPKAYLNWLVFDRDNNLIPGKSSYKRVLGGAENGSDVDFYRLAPDEDITITEAGYVYIWLSNENETPVEVYFDDFKVTQTKSPVVASNDYYAFGLKFSSFVRESSVPNTLKLFQGQEHVDDLGLNWDSFKWRNHMPEIGRFFNVDPLAEKFYYNSPYAFSENKVTAHIELEGLEAFGIHGTWSSSATWENIKELSAAMKSAFGNDEKEANFNFNWSGDNLSSARSKAALELISYIRANRSKDANEPITLIGHSHGGNVAVLAANMMSGMEEFNNVTINLVTINTPVREDYQLSEEAAARVLHFNIYDEKDPVQIRGGNDPLKFTGDTQIVLPNGYLKFVPAGKKSGLIMTGEKGDAGRIFKNAINIKTTKSEGLTGDFHNSHNSIKYWRNELLLKAQ